LKDEVGDTGLQDKVFIVVLGACERFGLASLRLGLEYTLSWLLAAIRDMQTVHPDLRLMRHPDLVRSVQELDDAEAQTWSFFDRLSSVTNAERYQILLRQAPRRIQDITATVNGIASEAERHLFSARLAAMARQWGTARVYAGEAARMFRDSRIEERELEARYFECVCRRHPPRNDQSLVALVDDLEALRQRVQSTGDEFGDARVLSERAALELRMLLNWRFGRAPAVGDKLRDNMENSLPLFRETATTLERRRKENSETASLASGRISRERVLELQMLTNISGFFALAALNEALDPVQLEPLRPAVETFLQRLREPSYFGRLGTLWVIKLNALLCHYLLEPNPAFLRQLEGYCKELLKNSEFVLSPPERNEIEESRRYAVEHRR
jgi:hypothetical protein